MKKTKNKKHYKQTKKIKRKKKKITSTDSDHWKNWGTGEREKLIYELKIALFKDCCEMASCEDSKQIHQHYSKE